MRQAQSGSALDNLSRQFGLSFDQTQRAVQALLPAFALGFQRSLQNPAALAQLFEMMGSGRYAPFFDAAGPAAQQNGNQVLDSIFGSPEAARQIAAQASAATGIAAQVLQQMLPALAAMLMGGLFRYASVEGMADVLRAWSDWLRALAPQQSRPAPNSGMGNPYAAWAEMVRTMLGQGPAPRQPEPAPDPWTGFMQAFLQGLPQGPGAPPPPPPPPAKPNPFELLAQMFQTGGEVQENYMAALRGVVDGFWRGQNEKAGSA
ncbi:DUF937 domain-containing protein [Enterovirga aerilata]|uniref:DUF937 domain-containing protein n=1 Tax=Enterovirga aerilata TaxID=2730920 RepID=A0A849IGC7_9HYPH|nr:DUF937 domain-containing protein [Enterovirga sp. DB1703]